MKSVLAIFVLMTLAQTAKAQAWQYMPENMDLVSEQLNKDFYAFNNVIVNFSMSKNREVAHLQILNNICPKVEGGISYLAMPAMILNASYALKLINTDSCGVKTYVSNNVNVGSRFMRDLKQFAQIKVQDFSGSICEMVYTSDVKVDLKNTTIDTKLNKIKTHFSTMNFNYNNIEE